MNCKILFSFLVITTLATASCGCRNTSKSTDNQDNDSTNNITSTMDTTAAKTSSYEEPIFEINTTEGTIVIMLYKETPLHRDNFRKLVAQHFYDSLLFHRVIYNFMIQTGDPLTRDTLNADRYGEGDPGYTIPAEFREGLTHKKGAVAAARMGDYVNPERESSGSQFYIVHNPEHCKHLDGQYTVFGETLSGFEVIDKIAASAVDQRNRPRKDIRIISINEII